jgi:trehalose synthase
MLGQGLLEDYRNITPDHILGALLAVAGDLRGARVAHINATPYGGGVSELLRSTNHE